MNVYCCNRDHTTIIKSALIPTRLLYGASRAVQCITWNEDDHVTSGDQSAVWLCRAAKLISTVCARGSLRICSASIAGIFGVLQKYERPSTIDETSKIFVRTSRTAHGTRDIRRNNTQMVL